MTAGFSVCLQLGSAISNSATITTTTSDAAFSKVLSAKDLASVDKTELFPVSSPPASATSIIDTLDIIVDGSELAATTTTTVYSPMELAAWVPLLKPEAMVSVHVITTTTAASSSSSTSSNSAVVDLSPITTSFLLAGLSSVSERKEADGSRVLVASHKAAAAAPRMSAMPLKKKSATTTNTNTVVTLNLGGGGNDMDDDDDMIDEDGLLDDTGLLAPPPAMNAQATASADDCSGRAPCDNCSCGRADAVAGGNAAAAAAPKQQAPSSSCGKCNLGDAFRCASCPYLGTPAFKAGEEHLVLQLTDDL